MTQFEELILKIFHKGGSVAGTASLCSEVQGDPREVLRCLDRARKDKLISSSRTHGGRGHRSHHRLTPKGARFVLTALGREYVQSK